MYTAVIVLFFAHSHLAVELDPDQTAADLVECEAQLGVLQTRVNRSMPWITSMNGTVLRMDHLCVEIGQPA